MDKYIKESDLFKRILNVDFKHDYDGCIKFCQSIPAADVVEERHGRWVDVEPAPYSLFYATCSVCGDRQTIEVANYCPMCGASMDEVLT